MAQLVIFVEVVICFVGCVLGFNTHNARPFRISPNIKLTSVFSVDSPSDAESLSDIDVLDGDATGADTAAAISDDDERRSHLKRSLLITSASYDRGYGSTPSSRAVVDDIIEKLEQLNPTTDASRGLQDGDDRDAPLEGIWQMVWTTAQDVLLLNASPLTTVGAIYQVIEPPVATNIIDLLPRGQALLPPGILPSLLRAEVKTKVEKRCDDMPLRLNLDFESVKLRPISVLGFDVDGFLPPLQYNLPNTKEILETIPGSDPENRPNFFDVVYLDEQMLIIRQNAPGGVFALVKSDSYEP